MVWVRERLGAERISERRACQVLGQARSTQRRERHIPDDEARLVAEMVELATHYGRYGYRRITAMLRWEGWKVNHKRVERLWRQEGLKVPSRQPKRRRLWLHDGSCVRLRAAHKDHVWSYDFVHERTHDGRAFRLLTLLDEYTRECLAIEVQRQMNHQDVLDRLAELFVDRGVPEYIRSDNGSEFTAQAVRDWLKAVGVRTLYIEPGSPWENGYVESFNGKLRDELLNVDRTRDAYKGAVGKPEIEDMLRETLVEIAREILDWDVGVTAQAQQSRPINDIFADEIKGFSKYKLAKAFLRWAREHEAADLTENEREQWSQLIDTINRALK